MIRLVHATGLWPAEWHIVFRSKAEFWWARWFAFGRYKHVMCFGKVPAVDGWLFYDFGVNECAIAVVPDGQADGFIDRVTKGALVLTYVPPLVVTGINLKPAFLCTSAVAHLTGVPSCALRPDAFLRDCLAAGARIVIEDDEFRTELSQTGPRDRAGEGSGAY